MTTNEGRLEQLNSNIQALLAQLQDELRRETAQGIYKFRPSSATKYKISNMYKEKTTLEKAIMAKQPSKVVKLETKIAEKQAELAEAKESYNAYLQLIKESSLPANINSTVIASLQELRNSMRIEKSKISALEYAIFVLNEKLEVLRNKTASKAETKTKGESK